MRWLLRRQLARRAFRARPRHLDRVPYIWVRLRLEYLEERRAPAVLHQGDLVLADPIAGASHTGALIQVDFATHNQTVISSGGSLHHPTGVFYAAAGNLLVANQGAGQILRVNPANGAQTVLATSGRLISPTGLATAGTGDLYVADQGILGSNNGLILKIDPTNGAQTVVASGGMLVTPTGVVASTNGLLYVVDPFAAVPGGTGGVLSINLKTGAQAVVSSGGFFKAPTGITRDVDGTLLVADPGRPGNDGQILRINPANGAQTVISANGSLFDPTGVAVEGIGMVAIADAHAANAAGGGALRVSLLGTGAQSTVTTGNNFAGPFGICVVPEQDTFPSSVGQVTLQNDNTGDSFEVNLSGPTTVHVTIGPIGQAADRNGDNRDEVQTEITDFRLTGSTPVGPLVVRLRAGYRSFGQIEEQSNGHPGILDLPPFEPSGTADSFFDLNLEVVVGTAVLHPANALHLMSVISHKPPNPTESYVSPLDPVPLLDQNDQMTGFRIVHARHTPNPYAGVLTYHNDPARTGQNLSETILNPVNVNAATFGRLYSYPVDGQIYAQPLYVRGVPFADGSFHNVVYVATEHDSVYAFDANGGGVLWQDSFIDPANGITTFSQADAFNCSQITPELGITDTPVIDPSTGTMYLVAQFKQVVNGVTTYHQQLHALDITTGDEMADSPVEIQASVINDSGQTVTFDPRHYKERAALSLVNGVVYTAWASHCDITPSNGWVIGYSAPDLQQVSVFNTSPNGSLDTIWQGNGGLATDGTALYFETGNGTDILGHGDDYSEAFLKLDLGDGQTVNDYFIPANFRALDQTDRDIGSGAPIVLPDQPGAHPHLLVGAGKDGRIFLLDRDNLGGLNNPPNGPDLVVQELANNTIAGGSWDTPAYFDAGDPHGPYIYYVGNGDRVKAFQLVNGLLTTMPTSQSPTAFTGNYGATPIISANQTHNGILWALENRGGNLVLHAYDAMNLARELYNSNQVTRDRIGAGVKFNSPIVVDGQVFVPTSNSLEIFGLLGGNDLPSWEVTPARTAAEASSSLGTADLGMVLTAGYRLQVHDWVMATVVDGTTPSTLGDRALSLTDPANLGSATVTATAGTGSSHPLAPGRDRVAPDLTALDPRFLLDITLTWDPLSN